MHKRAISALGIALLVPAGLLAAAPPASGQSSMTLSVGTPTLTSRVLLSVPVTVVCDPLADPNTFSDDISVSVAQASGRSITTGYEDIGGGTGSPFLGPPLLTCDGTTVNTVTVRVLPATGSGPFHGGPAIFTVIASHASGTCDPFCQITGSESAQVGPTSINVKG